MSRRHFIWLFALWMQCYSAYVYADTSPDSASQAEQASPARTSPSALERRIVTEIETRDKPFVLSPHKPNYVLPYTYNTTPNQAPFDPVTDFELQNEEIKFQISIKFAIAEHLFGEEGSIYFAYTNLSFWQAYNTASSSPFRETSHEPELFVTIPNDWKIAGFTNRLNMLGLVHQSNGRSGDLSRSWNRVYAEFIFERGDFYFGLKPWLRVSGSGQDDNPDIEDYLGHGEFRAVYASAQHTVSLMLRNTFSSQNYGAVEINYSFPMSSKVKWFLQYFDGYGESLIDYNARSQRFGIGIALTDWL